MHLYSSPLVTSASRSGGGHCLPLGTRWPLFVTLWMYNSKIDRSDVGTRIYIYTYIYIYTFITPMYFPVVNQRDLLTSTYCLLSSNQFVNTGPSWVERLQIYGSFKGQYARVVHLCFGHYIYIYIYMCVCVCVCSFFCVCVWLWKYEKKVIQMILIIAK